MCRLEDFFWGSEEDKRFKINCGGYHDISLAFNVHFSVNKERKRIRKETYSAACINLVLFKSTYVQL